MLLFKSFNAAVSEHLMIPLQMINHPSIITLNKMNDLPECAASASGKD